jgi:Glycosyltransferase family 87
LINMSNLPDGLGQRQLQDGHSVSSPERRFVQALLAAAIALAGVLVFAATIHTARMDYSEYWSSGKLLVHHTNPYSPAGVLAFEEAQGRSTSSPLVMLNPPWALFLVAPLGLVNVRAGLFMWTLAAIICVFVSARMLEAPSNDRALAFVFAPVLACILSGQSSPFLLLGFSLFLRFYKSRSFLAGASLLLMAIKPHLFLIFWAVLLVDCIYRRRFLILAGAATALAAATAFSMLFDIHIWRDYLSTLREFRIQPGSLPTASTLFRIVIDRRAAWLLLVPSALGIIWGLWYYSRRKHLWDWRIHGMLLMLVTILVSPYAFFSDEIVLLPSIAFALTLPEKRRYSAWILIAINVAALYIILVKHADLSTRSYIWTPITWLAWFLYATWNRPAGGTNLPRPLQAIEMSKGVSSSAV